METPPSPVLLFGAHGQLGQALSLALRVCPEHASVIPVSWNSFKEAPGNTLEQALQRLPPSSSLDVLFAHGQTNPKLGWEALKEANLASVVEPVQHLEAQRGSRVFRYLTLGSIQEHFPELCQSNPYLRSKWELARWMEARAQEDSGQGRYLHVRIHTVYGGPPKPHMFLGQLVAALADRRSFQMSSGDQLREYHHVEDIAQALHGLLHRPWTWGPFLDFNSGHPLSLAELAQAIFEAFGHPELLSVGSLPRAAGENTLRHFSPTSQTLLPPGRDTLAGVIESLRQVPELRGLAADPGDSPNPR